MLCRLFYRLNPINRPEICSSTIVLLYWWPLAPPRQLGVGSAFLKAEIAVEEVEPPEVKPRAFMLLSPLRCCRTSSDCSLWRMKGGRDLTTVQQRIHMEPSVKDFSGCTEFCTCKTVFLPIFPRVHLRHYLLITLQFKACLEPTAIKLMWHLFPFLSRPCLLLFAETPWFFFSPPVFTSDNVRGVAVGISVARQKKIPPGAIQMNRYARSGIL